MSYVNSFIIYSIYNFETKNHQVNLFENNA